MNPTLLSKACFLSLLAVGSLCAQPQSDAPLWVYDAGQIIKGSPAVAPDGTLYLAAGGNLHAITNSGSATSNKWIFPGGPSSTPAVAADGTIYVAGGNLYAINPDGTQKWSYPADAGSGSPAIAFDGTVYVHGYHLLHALSPEGGLKWTNRIGGESFYGSPAVASDGTIYTVSQNVEAFFAVNPDGTERWRAGIGIFNPGNSAAIGADGATYMSAGAACAFSPSGSNVWCSFAAGSPASPAIGKDGTIYVESYYVGPAFTGYGMALHAFSPSGEKRWAFETNLFSGPARILNTPAIDSAGVLYCTAYSRLFAVSADGNLQWTFDPGDASESYTSPTIGPDGTIYATFGSRLYAFAGTNKLADSPWPMYGQNARHTGKVEKPALKNPRQRSDANFQFQLYAQLGQTNIVVEFATNLSVWSSLTSIVITSVPMDFVDLTASNAPSRFYRTLSQ